MIVDHDARWLTSSTWRRPNRATPLRPWMVDIEHIDSTAVAGLAAKPIIDIQVGVVSLDVGTQIVAQAFVGEQASR